MIFVTTVGVGKSLYLLVLKFISWFPSILPLTVSKSGCCFFRYHYEPIDSNIFYAFQFIIISILNNSQNFYIWKVGYAASWLLSSCKTTLAVFDSFLALCYIARCTKLILFIYCLRSVISYFSNKPGFLLMVKGGDHNPDPRGSIHRFWCVWIILQVSVLFFYSGSHFTQSKILSMANKTLHDLHALFLLFPYHTCSCLWAMAMRMPFSQIGA